MNPSRHVRVRVDLQGVRRNAIGIIQRTGVALIAVIKANAYGLGAARIAPALADLVHSFCVFGIEEAACIDLWNRTGKSALALGPSEYPVEDYVAQHVRPAVADLEQARRYRAAEPALCVDTGQQRFACAAGEVPRILDEIHCNEAFTHATSAAQVKAMVQATAGKVPFLHAAGSSLLDDPQCWLSAVRPGLALYRGCVQVEAPLAEVRQSRGPAGYSGFVVPRHGVILGGYSNGIRPGPCRINGRPSRILEVGMQSSFVEASGADRAGDRAILLGDGLGEQEIASAWGTSQQEVLVRLCGSGIGEYGQ